MKKNNCFPSLIAVLPLLMTPAFAQQQLDPPLTQGMVEDYCRYVAWYWTQAFARAGGSERLGQLVGTEPLLAVPAVDERVGERGDVPARLPHARRHADGGVEGHDVVAQLHHRSEPRVLHVSLEQRAERPVVPRGAEPAIDLTGREYETAPLGQVDHAIHHVWTSHEDRCYLWGRRLR